MARLILLLVTALLAFAAPAPAQRSDDVAASARSVVRVVVVQLDGEEITDFGHGSGFAVGRNRIITNAHVVALGVSNPEGVAIGVVPSEGTQSTGARIIAVDPARDLALLEMQEGSLPVVPLFTGRLDGGAAVAALGYPGNVDLATAQTMQDYVRPLPPTRSMGNYSDLRQGDAGPTLIHTANIARGHSGGPLVDTCGRVIGVNRLITRNDQGDSTFGFAIPVASVVAFLREARQPFRAVSGDCVSLADRQRAEDERVNEERQARTADETARTRSADERRARTAAELQEARELRLGVAVLLLVLSLAAMGGTGILLVKNQSRPALIVGIAAVLLLVGAAVVFVTRPSLTGVGVDEGGAAVEDADRFAGANQCRLDRERSRLTISEDSTVPLRWQAGGCVNGNTQYAADGPVWRRVLVPSEEQTVTVSDFNPATGDYVVSRYLLGADAMGEARRLRRRVEQKSCTGDPDVRNRLAEQQRPLYEALPRQPNERLVYRCEPEVRAR